MFDGIKTSLADFGVHFDVYFAEQELRDRDELSSALARLRQSGHVYEAEGATWVRTTDSGDDPDQTLEVLIGQLVNLVRDGQPLRMSKRAGSVVTIDDLVGAIGVDAARYALARYSLDSPIDLDLDLWTRHSSDNPVYYVQYAHARIASLLRAAAELGITRGGKYDPGLLSHVRENDLLRALAEFPGVVASAAEVRQPHRIAR